MIIDPMLKTWATPAQAGYIDAVNSTGSQRKAADLLGIHRRAIQLGLKAVERKAALQGYAPAFNLNSIIPEPFVARGHSTMERIGPMGERTPLIQWTKTRLDDEQYQQMVREAIATFCDSVPKLTPVAPAPAQYQNDIIPWIEIGDAHFGMLAVAAETGEDFNLAIAENEMKGALGILIDELVPCERLVLNDLGDFTHYDNASKVTERSRNPLDTCSTYPEMIRVYSRTFRWIIEKALTKAQHVDVIINQANHSRTNDWWMAELVRVAYGHTGRVHVLNNDSPFIAYRMGKTLVMTHHSDLCKPKDLINVLTHDFREDFGQTEFHYIDIGHIHHGMVMKEHPSVFIESFNHLARNEAYSHNHGYRNRKSMTVILRSKTYGEVGRRTLPLQEIQDRIFGGQTPVKRQVHRVA